MSEIIVRRRHGLRLAGAKRLAQTMAERLRNEYGGSHTWDGDTLRFRRIGASGHVEVTRDDFEVHVQIGLLLAPLRSRIEQEILAFCDEHFGRETSAGDQPARAAALRRGATRSSRSQGVSRSARPK